MKLIFLVLALVIGFTHTSEAHRAHHSRYHHHYHHAHRSHSVPAVRDVTVLPHPAGCPQTAFCGCGASIEVFGENVRSLWLAANWYKFPRAEPAPGMVAVTRHHVAVLKEHIKGSVWMVIDHNGGHHKSYLHPRSIAGTTVVNPHGSVLSISNRAADRASISVHKHSVKRKHHHKAFSLFDLTQ